MAYYTLKDADQKQELELADREFKIFCPLSGDNCNVNCECYIKPHYFLLTDCLNEEELLTDFQKTEIAAGRKYGYVAGYCNCYALNGNRR